MSTPFSTSSTFFHSVGVNTHLNYGNLNYGNVPLVLSQLQDLGVGHVRDGLHTQNDDGDNVLYSVWNAVAKLGIKFNAVVDPRSNLGAITPALLNQFYWKSGMSIESLEGPNETDISGVLNWNTSVDQYQKALYSASKTMAQGITMSVISPSMAYAANGSKVGSLVGFLDYGNLHPYPAGQIPTTIFPSQMQYAAYVSGTKPVIATESGYHNAVNEVNDQPGVSELASAKYTLRMLLDNFLGGIVRTYIYELQDEGNDPSLSTVNSHWGLVRWDGTVKPAFTAVSNMLSLLGRGNPTVTPLNYTLTGASPSSLLLQQDDNSWLLFLWQESIVWNTTTKVDVTNRDINVGLTIPSGFTASVYEPLFQKTLVNFFTGTQSLAIPDHPIVVLIKGK